MKNHKQNFRIISLTVAIIIATLFTVKAQVVTRVLALDDKIENYIPWYNPNREAPIVKTPLVNVDSVLEEDRRTGRVRPRIGIKQDVNYTLEDGRFTQLSNFSLWEMIIYSENAKSMSIRFDNTNLPNEAVMFLYNEDTRFVVGPITYLSFREGTFRSDYLNGDRIYITIFMPTLDNLITINITSFDHGIIPLRSYDDAFGTSEECNINVACDEGNGWECQINSVCKIIHSTIGSCTGSLINNDCCDLTPYILTANHCTAGYPVDDYLFRFNYQSPQCTPTGETTPLQWVVYFGSELRASWDGTDFSLLELTHDIEAYNGISFCGWDRRSQTPHFSTYIHHPSGDVKKITFDAGINTIEGTFYRFELTPNSNGDFGTLEGGSSGCPKYNRERLIIGQHYGGTPKKILCKTKKSENFDGRFDLSWGGNGTNATRLRNWLGPSTNPPIMGCMENPYIMGPDILCTDSGLFSLVNNMPCAKNVTWSVEPTSLFHLPTSGNGNFAILTPRHNANGDATLTYTLSSPNCNDAIVQKRIWVGKPDFNLFGDEFLCLNDFGFAFIVSNGTNNGFNWLIDGAVTGEGEGPIADYQATEPGWGMVCASTTNSCGEITKCFWVEVEDCGDGYWKGDEYSNRAINNNANTKFNVLTDDRFVIYPNPSKNIFNVDVLDADPIFEITIQILDANGRVIKSIISKNNSIPINFSNHPAGLYFIKCAVGDKIMYGKFFKI